MGSCCSNAFQAASSENFKLKQYIAFWGNTFIGGVALSQLKGRWKNRLPAQPPGNQPRLPQRGQGVDRERQFDSGESLRHFSGGKAESEEHDLNCYCYYCALSTGTNEPGVQTRSSCNISKASPPAGPGSAPHPGWAGKALPKLLHSQKVFFFFKVQGGGC